jgi:hypothetical protein
MWVLPLDRYKSTLKVFEQHNAAGSDPYIDVRPVPKPVLTMLTAAKTLKETVKELDLTHIPDPLLNALLPFQLRGVTYVTRKYIYACYSARLMLALQIRPPQRWAVHDLRRDGTRQDHSGHCDCVLLQRGVAAAHHRTVLAQAQLAQGTKSLGARTRGADQRDRQHATVSLLGHQHRLLRPRAAHSGTVGDRAVQGRDCR